MSNIKYRFNKEEHIHELEKEGKWSPLFGTSTVLNVLAKGGLTWWASGMACQELGWHPVKVDGKYAKKEDRLKHTTEKFKEIKAFSEDEYFALLDKAYYAHNNLKNKSAVAGTDLHAKCEEWVKGQIDGSNVAPDPQIEPLVKWSNMNVDKWLWSEVHCYSTEHWLGGISDMGFIDKEGKVGILDIKSSKEAYISQFIQCAGYDIQITENGGFDSNGEKIFDLEGKEISYYAILPFGMKEPEVQTKHNVNQLKKAFISALTLHEILNNN